MAAGSRDRCAKPLSLCARSSAYTSSADRSDLTRSRDAGSSLISASSLSAREGKGGGGGRVTATTQFGSQSFTIEGRASGEQTTRRKLHYSLLQTSGARRRSIAGGAGRQYVLTNKLAADQFQRRAF